MWPLRPRTSEASGTEPRSRPQPNSLFGEILDWLLAPLLFLWPISIIVTHNVADGIANQPYDRALADSVRALAELVVIENNIPTVHFPAPARTLFRTDQNDTVYYQVATQYRYIAGDREIPWTAPPPNLISGEVLFRNDTIQNEEVRIAYLYLSPSDTTESPIVLAQVAETRNKRADLASRVVTGVLLPQFAIIPLAVVLVWVGLTRGIAPLNRLQSLIRGRRPTDLSPIPPASVPEEVRPLIVAFNDMMARLEENLQAQQRFIADAAHQMRTPLTGLKMQTDLALMEEDPAQLRQSLARIAESTERASHLINQLLSLARAESSFEKLYTVDQVDLGAVMRSVVQEIFPRATIKNIDLGIEDTTYPIRVEGNAVLLKEMVKNLIDNAIKYTPNGGCVTARSVYANSNEPVFEVEDTGIGIPESEYAHIFERFYRVLGSGVDGSGLGLPIVREIADLHRATIALLPNPNGQGTLARVTFPPAPPHASAHRPKSGHYFPLG